MNHDRKPLMRLQMIPGPCLAGLLALFTVAPALAAPLTVINPGFEDTSGSLQFFNEFTFGPLPGWDLYEDPIGLTSGGNGPDYFIGTLTPFEPDPIGNPGVFANFPDGAPEGQRVGIAFNFFESAGGGEYGFIQTLNDTLQPNTEYELQVLVGNITSATAMSGEFFPLQGFPGYRVDLLAGDEVLKSDNNTLAGSINDGEFGLSSFTYVTGNTHDQFGQNLAIRLVNLNTVDPAFPTSDLEVDFDDVSLTATPVPEPNSIALVGLLALVWLVRRRPAHLAKRHPSLQRSSGRTLRGNDELPL